MRTHPMLGTLLAALCTFATGLAPAQAPSPETLAKERAIVTTGLAAKLMASAVFIAGRDPEKVVAQDLTSAVFSPDQWRNTKFDVDRKTGRVTVTAPGVGERVAVFTGENAQGAVLLPVGETALRFKPQRIARNLPPPDSAWPLGDRIDPAARPAGIKDDVLKAALASAFEGEGVQHQTRALVVLYKGQLIAERYADGFRADMPLIGWSMGKTISATLLGIVSTWDPPLDLQAPAPIAAWQGANDPRAKITTANLMHMSGGLNCPNPGIDKAEYMTSHDFHNSPYRGILDAHVTMLAPALKDPPGSRWQYCNANTFALLDMVRERVRKRGVDYLSFPQQALFDKIGARSFVLETDVVGNFLLTGFDYATPRDWARFGEFLRRDGVAFDGKRLLPEGWVEFMRKPAPMLKDPYYGGQTWLNRDGMFPSMPRDLYFARGAGEQLTIVIPSRELVIVRMGNTRGEKEMWALYPHFDKVMAGVLSALPAP